MKTLRQIVNERDRTARITDHELQESLVGKGVAIVQNRQHAGSTTKLINTLNKVQSICRDAVLENDQSKKIDTLFQVGFELAGALKLFAEMSANINNISTTAVLDAENIQKVLDTTLNKLQKTLR